MQTPVLRWTVAAGMLLALIVVPFALFEGLGLRWAEGLAGFEGQHWLLAGLIVLALALDVFLPVPSSLVILMALTSLDPLPGAFVVWTGLTLGCALGYLAGVWAGQPFLGWWIGQEDVQSARRRISHLGAPALILARPVPVLAEATCLLAGAVAYPPVRFMVLTSLANVAVTGVYSASLSLLATPPQTPAILAACIALALVMAFATRWRS